LHICRSIVVAVELEDCGESLAGQGDRAELARCVKAREIFLSMPFNLFRQAERLCDRYALQKKTVFSTQACLNLLVEKEKTQAFLDELSALNYLIEAQCGAERDFIIPVGGGENK